VHFIIWIEETRAITPHKKTWVWEQWLTMNATRNAWTIFETAHYGSQKYKIRRLKIIPLATLSLGIHWLFPVKKFEIHLALFARFIFSCSTTPNGIQFFVFMDLYHRKFMMGTQLWCNKVYYHLSLMVCTFLIKRNFNLSILIFIIKLFKIAKDLVILSSIVPTIKFS